jgi:hypothetical protein
MPSGTTTAEPSVQQVDRGGDALPASEFPVAAIAIGGAVALAGFVVFLALKA